MTGPSTPGQEGPSYAPPPLPEGWIAQWDGMSRKYYFVVLSTGVSQWDVPTHPAPTGPTPQATPQGADHPYGMPGPGQGQQSGDGTMGPEGGDGERGLGSSVLNMYMHKQSGGGKPNKQSSGLMGMATSLLGGSKPNQGSGHSNSSGGAAGIVGALAGSLLGGSKPNQQQQQHQTNYTGQPSAQQHGSGGMMSSLGGMFGGHGSSGNNTNYGYSGYSHNGSTPQGGYTGAPPPTAYQPGSGTPGSHSQPSHQPYSQPQTYGGNPPYGGHGGHESQPYGAAPQHQPHGGSQPPYGQGPPAQQYGSQYPQGGYDQNQHYGGHHQGHQGAPPVPSGSRPQHGHYDGAGGPPSGYGGSENRW